MFPMKKRILSLVLVLCLALPFVTASAFAAKDYSAYVSEVIILEGDTVSSICENLKLDFDKTKNAIMIVNGMSDASSLDVLRPGQKLLMPKTAADAETIEKLYSAVVSAVIPASYVKKYTVQSGDTVYDICRGNGLDFSICKDAILSLNEWSGGKDLTAIYVGQELVLPISDSVAKEISKTIAKASDMNINVSANSEDEFVFYLVEYTLSSGESIKSAVAQLGIEYTKDIEAKIKGINGLTDLSKVQAGKKYLLPSSSADNMKYAIYSHKVIAGDTSAKLCKAMGVEYNKVKDMLSALNTKASFPEIKKGAEILLAAPRGGEQGKTPVIIK